MGTQIIRVHTQGDSLGFQNYYKFLRRLFIANKTKGFCSCYETTFVKQKFR